MFFDIINSNSPQRDAPQDSSGGYRARDVITARVIGVTFMRPFPRVGYTCPDTGDADNNTVVIERGGKIRPLINVRVAARSRAPGEIVAADEVGREARDFAILKVVCPSSS